MVEQLTGGDELGLLLVMEQQANAFISSPKLQGLLQWAMSLSDESLPNNQMLASRALLLHSVIDIAGDSNSASVIARDIANDIANDNDNRSVRVITRARARASDSIIAIASDIARVRASTNVITRASDIVIDISSIITAVSDSYRTNESDDDSDIAIDYEALSSKLEDLRGHIPSSKATSDEWQKLTDQLIDTFLIFFHLDKELITFSPEESEVLENYLYATKLIIDCKNAAVRVSRKEWEAIEARLLTPPGEENQD